MMDVTLHSLHLINRINENAEENHILSAALGSTGRNTQLETSPRTPEEIWLILLGEEKKRVNTS